jgi:hypothetical protein
MEAEPVKMDRRAWDMRTTWNAREISSRVPLAFLLVIPATLTSARQKCLLRLRRVLDYAHGS